MRLHVSAALIALAAAIAAHLPETPARAAEIAAATTLDAVTVYRSGAQVSRLADQEIDAGAHTLVIKDLPAGAVLGSIRVEGKSDGDLRIGAVDAKRVQFLSGDAERQSSARKELEEDLERLTDAMDQLRSEIETREAQKTFIANLTSLPQHPPANPRDGSSPNQDWSRLLNLIGSSMADIQGDILKTRIAMRELGRRIEDVKKQLSELAPKQERRTEVRISVEAATKLKAALTIKYQVGNASWRPHYDARLETGSADKPGSLLLTRRASIQQQTGETWTDVALKLSTSQPSGQSAAPELTPLTVDFREPPRPVPTAQYRYSNRKGGSNALQSAPQSEAMQDQAAAARPVMGKIAKESTGILERTAFQASFSVPGRITVLNTGEAKRVKLDDQNIAPKLNIRTVPRRDTNAYLYANLQMPTTAPYLAGPVSLFRDGGFVGMGRLPNLAPGADHELGFGSDASVIVKYHILGEKRGETGIISSSATDQRNFKIEITNQHPRSIDVVVIDQMPVSLNEDITVDLLGPSTPTKRNYDDKRGLLAWQFALDAGAKQTVNFGYTISWPADKQIGFGYRR
jgi:uncharacterized protein (TIGR02231 family)